MIALKFPCFSEFLDTITPEQVKEIMDRAQETRDKAVEIGPGGEVPTVSWTITLELLAKYHLWLENALQGRE